MGLNLVKSAILRHRNVHSCSLFGSTIPTLPSVLLTETMATTSCMPWQLMETSHSTGSFLHVLGQRWHLLLPPRVHSVSNVGDK